MSRSAICAAIALGVLGTAALLADEEKENDAVAAMMDATRDSFLTVYCHAQRLPADQRDEEDESGSRNLSSYIQQEYPMEMTGVAFGPKGWVLVLAAGGSVRKIRAESSVGEFSPAGY